MMLIAAALAAQRAEERTVDARATFVRHIAKKVDDAHRQHEGERGRGGQREERLLHIGGLFRGELREIVDAKRLLARRHPSLPKS
jgi:hypothetical protein